MSAKTFFSKLLAVLVAASLLIPAPARVEAAPLEDPVLGTTAMVLVNSSSGRFTDFDRFIKPYLDHFGIPYTIVDIFVDDNIIADINAYSLIVIGHSEIDIEDDYLDESEEQYILDAVAAGAGLVNFDNTLSWVTEAEQRVPLYDFVNTIFHFGYTADVTTSGVSFSDDEMHYITQLHEPGETITTGNMTLAGITLPENVTSLVNSENHPFLTAVTYESGRAVQWGSYDWMSHAVKGPVYGLDDLVWRSIVWAARKPFVMQGMPPFVTMRMDDTIGPLDWIHIANEYGFKPWAGIFINNINDDEAIDLKELVDTGKATTALHAFSPTEFFYFDHGNGINFPDNQIADYFDTADQWFNSRQIQTSKYLVGHYYELGSNVFEELYDRGFRYVGTMMNPGRPEAGSSWIMNGPFRSYEEGTTTDQYPLYYADYLKIPGHNELDEKFFNCVTEIRDVTGYEWNPNQDVQNSIDQGTQWLKRALMEWIWRHYSLTSICFPITVLVWLNGVR